MNTTRRRPSARPGEEIWETTTEGTVWVRKTDDRGRTKLEKVGGKVGARLRIKILDREIAQDAVSDEVNDPFTNGLLKRVDASQNDDEQTASPHALTTEELMVGFSKSGNAFQAYVNDLSEFNVRRMAEMAEAVDASASQIAYLEKKIREEYRVGGDTPTYQEMAARGDVAR